MPDSAMIVGLLVASLLTVSVPVRTPVTVGVKVTLTVHEALTASEPPSSCSSRAKSPLARMNPMAAGSVPVLVSVTDWAPLVLPTAGLVNVRLVGTAEMDAGGSAGAVERDRSIARGTVDVQRAGAATGHRRPEHYIHSA